MEKSVRISLQRYSCPRTVLLGFAVALTLFNADAKTAGGGELTPRTFASLVASSSGNKQPLAIFFRASWCRHSAAALQAFQSAAITHSDVVDSGSLDCSVYPRVCDSARVATVPSLVLFRNGKIFPAPFEGNLVNVTDFTDFLGRFARGELRPQRLAPVSLAAPPRALRHGKNALVYITDLAKQKTARISLRRADRFARLVRAACSSRGAKRQAPPLLLLDISTQPELHRKLGSAWLDSIVLTHGSRPVDVFVWGQDSQEYSPSTSNYEEELTAARSTNAQQEHGQSRQSGATMEGGRARGATQSTTQDGPAIFQSVFALPVNIPGLYDIGSNAAEVRQDAALPVAAEERAPQDTERLVHRILDSYDAVRSDLELYVPVGNIEAARLSPWQSLTLNSTLDRVVCHRPSGVRSVREAGEEAMAAYKKGSYLRAVMLAEHALQRASPIELEALGMIHFNLGLFLTKCGRQRESISFYEESLSRYPSHAPTMVNLGLALERLGQTGRALALYRRAIEIQPDLEQAQLNYKHLLVAQHHPVRKYVAQVPLYKRKTRRNPHLPVLSLARDARKAASQGRPLPIPRRSNLTLDEFANDFAIPGIPVIITDAMTHWGAKSKWTCDFFRTEYSDVDVIGFYDGRQPAKLGDALGGRAQLRQRRDPHKDRRSPTHVTWYWDLKGASADTTTNARKEQVLRDIGLPYFLPDTPLNRWWHAHHLEIFWGYDGAGADTHVDKICSGQYYSAQYTGAKRWRLGPLQPDGSLTPSGRPWVPVYEDVLRAGEMIVFPPGWVHETRIEGSECSVASSHEFDEPPAAGFWRTHEPMIRRHSYLRSCYDGNWKDITECYFHPHCAWSFPQR